MTGQIPEVELDQSQRPGRQQPTGRLARQAGNVDEERWHPEGTIHSASYKVEELPSPPLLFRLNWARCLEAAIPTFLRRIVSQSTWSTQLRCRQPALILPASSLRASPGFFGSAEYSR
jgi:hypothetical protein